MSPNPTYFYDEDVDVLYISFSPGEKATGAVGLHDNILLRFNFAEKRAIGLTLMDFSVLVQRANLGPRSFPLTGLQDLEEDRLTKGGHWVPRENPKPLLLLGKSGEIRAWCKATTGEIGRVFNSHPL